MDAFDADVLIYAAAPAHPLGRRVRRLFSAENPGLLGTGAGIGSVLLLPELLSKPMRDGNSGEVAALVELLAHLDLLPAAKATARLAVDLAAVYRLGAAGSIHLATAVIAGADRFITNNSTDFPKSISEIAVTYPADLPGPDE